MAGSYLGVVCRVAVAAVLLLTAAWKLTNPVGFRSAFRRFAPVWLAPADRVGALALGALEVVLSVLLVAGIAVGAFSLIAPAVAFAMVAIFTFALATHEAGGCGCWETPLERVRRAKAPLVARNAILLLALLGAATLTPDGVDGLTLVGLAAPVASGVLIAVILVEAPQIAAVATFHTARGAGR